MLTLWQTSICFDSPCTLSSGIKSLVLALALDVVALTFPTFNNFIFYFLNYFLTITVCSLYSSLRTKTERCRNTHIGTWCQNV